MFWGESDLHLDHLQELLLLVLPELLVLLHTLNVKLVLCLWPGWLEGARENRDLGVADGRWHLRMGHVLVHHHTLDERGIFQRTTDFAVHFDELKVDVATAQIRDREDCVNSDGRKLLVGDGDAGPSALKSPTTGLVEVPGIETQAQRVR